MVDSDPPSPPAPSSPTAPDRSVSEADAVRSELLSAQVELGRLRRQVSRVAEEHAAAVAEARRLQDVIARSPGARIARRLRGVGAAAESQAPPPGASTGFPLASLRSDLRAGWPQEAEWLTDALVGAERATALRQPVASTIRYRLAMSTGSVVRTRALLSATVWREASAPATVTLRLLGGDATVAAESTCMLVPAVGGGVWEPLALELVAPNDGEFVLELHAAAEPTLYPVPHVLWVSPEVRPAGTPARLAPLAPAPMTPPASGSTPVPATSDGPRFSILTPVRDPEPGILREALDSVRAQTLDDWESCLVDDASDDPEVRSALDEAASADPRITLTRHPVGEGIAAATNAALAMASGTYVALLDHDDRLAPDALQKVAEVIDRDPDLDLVYGDEDHLTALGHRFERYCKPDFAPDTLRSQMYIGHLCVIRRTLVEELGGWRTAFDGSQDYDLVLRAVERTQRIAHCPEVLYHWRVIPRSAASGERAKPYAYDAARRALQEHLERSGMDGTVQFGTVPSTYRIVFEPPPQAAVEIVVPVAAPPGLGQVRTLHQALAVGGNDRWSVVLQGPPEATSRWAAELPSDAVSERAEAESPSGPGYLLILNGPLVAASEGWLRVMLGLAALDGVGAVGAKVLSPSGRVEHAGVVVGGGLPLPVCHGAGAEEPGHMSTLLTSVNRSAVSGVVLVPRAALDRLEPVLGPLAVVDHCLRARERGLRVIWTPDAVVTGDSPAINDLGALAAFRARWGERIAVDPFYNPCLWQERADYQLLDND